MRKLSCMIVDDDEISTVVLKNFIELSDFLELDRTFDNPIVAFQHLQNHSGEVDLLFLDVEMPNISGIEILKMLKEKPQTILVTSHKGFALDAFDLDVIDYITKPIDYPRFLKAVTKAKANAEKKEPAPQDKPAEDSVFVKVNNKLVKINYEDILYIEALSDYIIIKAEGNKQHIVYSTLKAFEEKLKTNPLFLRVHRSYIVNLKKIEVIEDSNLLIKGTYIPVGNKYESTFLERIKRI